MSDLDRDGIPDVFDLDVDGDGVSNEDELRRGADPRNELDGGGRSFPTPTPTPTPAPTPPPAKPKTPVEITQVRDDARVQDFLEKALAQIGDQYKLGAEASLKDADPDQFDGSELVEWAANRSGVMINDGAANQYRQMSAHGTTVSVEQALQTPGAILYEFTGDPARPTRASTAISLGDGRIIDIDPVAGVRIMPADQFTFTHAGTMPGFVDGASPEPGALSVVQEAYAKHGLEPTTTTPPADPTTAPDADPTGQSDATPTGTDPTITPDDPSAPDGEADALTARARGLRDDLVKRLESEESTYQRDERALEREVASSTAAVRSAQEQLEQANRLLDMDKTVVAELEAGIAEAKANDQPLVEAERRESLEKIQAQIRADERQVTDLTGERDRLVDQVVDLNAKLTSTRDAGVAATDRRVAAESAIDALEEKARYLHEADEHAANATRLREEATKLREDGKDAEADKKIADAVSEGIAAEAKRTTAAEQAVDEAAITAAGLGGAPAPSTDPLSVPSVDPGEPAAAPSGGDRPADGPSPEPTEREDASPPDLSDISVPQQEDVSDPDLLQDASSTVDFGADELSGFADDLTPEPEVDQSPAFDGGEG